MPGRKATGSERREQILGAALRIATDHGLEGMTVRRVAEAAGLSHGLVHFHFRSKAELLSALLDRVLDTTTALDVGPAIARLPSPLERLLALLTQEMRRLAGERRRTHLFFDFWVMGLRHPRIRVRMRAELERYREAFRPMVEEVLRADPERFAGVTPEGLSAVVVAFIKGSAVQSVIDPRGFDVARFAAAASALLAQLDAGDPQAAVSSP